MPGFGHFAMIRSVSSAHDSPRSRFPGGGVAWLRFLKQPYFVKLLPLLALAGLISLATGCGTYAGKVRHMTYQWENGNALGAAQEFGDKAKKAGKIDGVVWHLEHGAAERAAGHYAESTAAFAQAEQRIDAFEESAKVSLTGEAAAVVANQATLPYKGYAYDKIMLNTYCALNALQLGDRDTARVQLLRAYKRQQDAVVENKKRIEQSIAEAENRPEGQAINQSRNDAGLQASLQSQYASLDQLPSYADYVNPFTVFLDGLYFMACSTGMSDLERAKKSFERLRGYSGDNAYVKQDLEAIDGLMAGRGLAPTTYVIFETGCAPFRDQVRIDIPIIFTRVSYVGAAFPVLRIRENYCPSLNASGGGRTENTALVSSMDRVVTTEFKNELPAIIARTVAATVVKGAATYFVNQAADHQGEVVGILSRLVTAGVQIAINVADTRTWTTLPKEFQYCRLPTPADRKLRLATAVGGHATEIALLPGTINVVYVKSISATAPLTITQFTLK